MATSIDPKKTKRESTQTTTDLACPNCGMLVEDWPDEGYSKGDETFCCQGCADGTGCTCME